MSDLGDARPQERLLIDSLEGYSPRGVLCASQGLAELALAAAGKFPQAKVACHYLDLYRAEQARRRVDQAGGSLSIVCSPDLPCEEIDLAALPFSAQGEAELTRELLQQAHQRLTLGGTLMAGTDNPRDRWLHAEMRKLFAAVTRREHTSGAVYVARKSKPLERVRNFTCEFAFRDHGRLIHAVSRPGVFSHRRVDPGARQLMAAMEIGAGDRVLDIGCGSGTVALAAACRAEGVSVLAIDSCARAVECTALGAARNGLSHVAVEHTATGISSAGQFDAALANPPYYAEFRIARFFLETAHAALRSGGRVYLVMKQPDWYAEHMPRWFRNIVIEPAKDYWIARGIRA